MTGINRPTPDVSGLSELADCELVSSLVLHNEEAFAELFRRHSKAVGAASRMILGHGSLCDDVVAEVFLALWLTPGSFDPARGSLLGFLRLKAKGRSIDIVRAETARARRESTETQSRPRAEESFDSNVIAAETAAELTRAINSLAAHERQPIELAFYKGMAYRTIAVYLGIPEGTTKSRIRSGLRHLREHLESPELLVHQHQTAITLPATGVVRQAAHEVLGP